MSTKVIKLSSSPCFVLNLISQFIAAYFYGQFGFSSFWADSSSQLISGAVGIAPYSKYYFNGSFFSSLLRTFLHFQLTIWASLQAQL